MIKAESAAVCDECEYQYKNKWRHMRRHWLASAAGSCAPSRHQNASFAELKRPAFRTALVCDECAETCSNKQVLNSHNLFVHRTTARRQYSCFDCQQLTGSSFIRRSDLYKHSRRHHRITIAKPLTVECFYCSKRSTTKGSLRWHIVIRHSNSLLFGAISCYECSERFHKKSDFLRHFTVHHLPKMFVCFSCSRNFGVKQNLIIHHQSKIFRPVVCFKCSTVLKCKRSMVNHFCESAPPSAGEFVQCYECDKRYDQLHSLALHTKTVHEAILLICDDCGNGFNERSVLMLHASAHGLRFCFTCEISVCKKTFLRKGYLRQHVRKNHENINKADLSFSCADCRRCYISASQLKKHMDRVHHKIKPYQCAHCSKWFSQTGHRTTHILTNHWMGEKPFKCDDCNKNFNNKIEMKHHVLKHIDDIKPHRCDQCNYATHHAGKLTRHKQGSIHSNERPHKCSICGKKFPYSERLSAHLALHAIKRHPCNECKVEFSFKANLARHRKSAACLLRRNVQN